MAVEWLERWSKVFPGGRAAGAMLRDFARSDASPIAQRNDSERQSWNFENSRVTPRKKSGGGDSTWRSSAGGASPRTPGGDTERTSFAEDIKGQDTVRRSPERKFFIDNLLVRITLILERILVDRPCAMGF